jgi:uncharacterized coiled-coil protein SlyX
MRVRWRERPRAHRWAIVGAFVGMAVGAIAVFQYAFYGSTFDRWLINGSGLARRRRCRTLVGEGHDEMTRPNLVRTRVAAQESLRCRVLLLVVFGLAGLVVPRAASAQRADDRAQFDARMNVLDRSVADLSIQIERLNARDRELQHQLEKMRTNYDQRLERLEKGAAPKTPPPRRSKP